MRKILYLFIVVFFCACSVKPVPEEIIIEGNVRGVPDGKLYLADAFRPSDVRDSADCVEGRFKFVIRPDKSFVPYLATIYSGDPSNPTKVKRLSYRNHMKGADSVKTITSEFYMEKGLTRISGENGQLPYLRIFAGRETDLFFARGFAFGWLSAGNPAQRQLAIDRRATEIKKHSYSYFLLQNLFFNKAYYSETELKGLFALFDSEVRASKLGNDFRTYFNNRVDPGEAYPKLSFTGPDGQKRPVIDPQARLNMLVFWSSWCGPCRREIPVIKAIEQEYRGKGLNLVSISIDEYKHRWSKALSEEKMSWPQFIVDSAQIRYVTETFNFVAIPLVIFTDDKGVELARFTGNEEGDRKKYQDVVNRYIGQ